MNLKLQLTDKMGRCSTQLAGIRESIFNFSVLLAILTASTVLGPLLVNYLPFLLLVQSCFAQASPALSPSCFLFVCRRVLLASAQDIVHAH